MSEITHSSDTFPRSPPRCFSGSKARAIIAARSQIVKSAVSMVEMALKGLSSRDIVELDEERKAAMVSNLLVVLCGDKATQPVLNTDTL